MKVIGENIDKEQYNTMIKIETYLFYCRLGMELFEVNAFYNNLTNTYSLLFGILQYPFYDPDLPITFKYGSIGMIMGHEMLHGFDTESIDTLYISNIYNLTYIIYFVVYILLIFFRLILI